MREETTITVVIDPKRLRAIRGTRSRREIVEGGGDGLTIQRLYEWEHGLCQPRAAAIPALLRGLGVTFEDLLTAEEAV